MAKAKSIGWSILAVILVLSFGIFSFFYWGNYSEGERAGVVMKVSKRGTFMKTWEGQLNMQGFGATDSKNQFSQTWEFSVEKDRKDVIKALEDAALSGERVNVYYIERYMKAPWRGETLYFVRNVRTKDDP